MLKRADHVHWGEFASADVLPNVSGSPNTTSDLSVGDLAFVTGASTYQCIVPTAGFAEWAAMGSWEGYKEVGEYMYSQADTPVPEVIGQLVLKGGVVSASQKLIFTALVTPDFSVVGNVDIRLWDLGPSGGPPETPRLVSTLNTSTDGLQRLSQELTVVSAGPSGDQVLNTERIYEITVEQSSIFDDTVYVGSAGLSIEVA